jgi:soluble lytic murein transglycosylase-like protein
MGLMQLMPATARRYGVSDPFDSLENVRGGTRYLHDLLGIFNNDIELTVAAYNAGEQAVIRHGNRIPPYRETLEYVPRVLSIYRDLRARM